MEVLRRDERSRVEYLRREIATRGFENVSEGFTGKVRDWRNAIRGIAVVTTLLTLVSAGSSQPPEYFYFEIGVPLVVWGAERVLSWELDLRLKRLGAANRLYLSGIS